MKTAPITVTEMVLIGGVCVAGFVAWRAYSALPSPAKVATTVKDVITSAPADAVSWAENNNRIATDNAKAALAQKYPDQRTAVQSWVADTVQKGQDAGASSFVTSFFTGLFK